MHMTTASRLTRQLRLLATLLVVSAIQFVIGTRAERMAGAGAGPMRMCRW